MASLVASSSLRLCNSNACFFEWTQVQGERHVIHTGEVPQRVDVPDYASLLPPEIQAFTTGGVYDDKENAQRSFVQGGGHGGSHPHLAHEFLSSIVQDREPYPKCAPSSQHYMRRHTLSCFCDVR